MKRFAFLWAQIVCTIGVWGAALAQTGDGYVGVYSDSLGTTPCASVPPMTGTTLYVIAKTAGASSSGIAGVEFRIELMVGRSRTLRRPGRRDRVTRSTRARARMTIPG